MKTVLITGASGYIGRHVLEAFKSFDANVIAVDRNNSSTLAAQTVIDFDIFREPEKLLSLTGPIDACLHLAWRNGFVHNDPSHMTDLSSHFRFIKALVDGEVPQIAVMGSMHEIGYWEGPIDETTPCDPQSFYGIAKDALRRSCFLEAADSASRIQWLRGFYIYGDDQGSQSIFGKIFRAAQAGEKTFPFTSGQNQYDFIHINDLARQITSCVMQDSVTGIINCCSGEPRSLADQVESYIKENDLAISLDFGAFPDRPYDSPAIWGDNTKITQILAAQKG